MQNILWVLSLDFPLIAHRGIHTVMGLFCMGSNAVVQSDKTMLALHGHKGSGQARGQH